MWDNIIFYFKLLLLSVVIVAVYFGSRYVLGLSKLDIVETLLDKKKPPLKRIGPLLLVILFCFVLLIIFSHIKGDKDIPFL